MSDSITAVDALRETVATACRILGHTGVAREITGHVSARVPGASHEIVIRCRTADEAGLATTTVNAVRIVSITTGEVDDPSIADPPIELPIHSAVLGARPEVGAVVHVHPKYCVLCGLAGIPLRPIFGAYEHHATVMADEGVPVFDNSMLVRDAASAHALVAAMGSSPVCLMRGHGITVVGATVEQATLRAVRLEHLAEMTWHLRSNGFDPTMPDSELAVFRATRERPVLDRGERWAWNHYALAADTAARVLRPHQFHL
jgi:ribulose-5-phosphate 4-epimerase/fuculose-1-phosphate aldolase